MKNNILAKDILTTSSVHQNPTTRIMVHTRKAKLRKPMDKNPLTIVTAETKNKIQPTDDFLYSGRCYCGIY